MTISCSCDFDGGRICVREKEVTCRTQRKCDTCSKDINILDRMYHYSMFDYDEMMPSAPIFLCEECGDLAATLSEYEFCFNLGENIRDQWLDHLHDVDPTNIALKGTAWDLRSHPQ